MARLDAHDRALYTRWALGAHAGRPARDFWAALSRSGGATASIGICIASCAVPSVSAALVWRALFLLGASQLAVAVIKRRAARTRPAVQFGTDAWVEVPDPFSFPSGHSCAAMSVALTHALAFPSLAVPLLAWAMLVGMSRVMLGVHYPGDVVVGRGIALAFGVILR